MTLRNAARERHRVQSLRDAFQTLQSSLPSVPPDTKLSKLDVLILAGAYIGHLTRLLLGDRSPDSQAGVPCTGGHLHFHHPVKVFTRTINNLLMLFLKKEIYCFIRNGR